MFSELGLPELILIFLVALLVFGPKSLPELGKSLGQALRGDRFSTRWADHPVVNRKFVIAFVVILGLFVTAQLLLLLWIG